MADHLGRVAAWIDGETRGSSGCAPVGRGRVLPPHPRRASTIDVDRFYDVLLARHGTYVGPGHWFDADRRHFRLGYGWPTTADLDAGLAGLSKALDDATT